MSTLTVFVPDFGLTQPKSIKMLLETLLSSLRKGTSVKMECEESRGIHCFFKSFANPSDQKYISKGGTGGPWLRTKECMFAYRLARESILAIMPTVEYNRENNCPCKSSIGWCISFQLSYTLRSQRKNSHEIGVLFFKVIQVTIR